MPVRLIALDIDGTLYDDRKEILPRTLAALRRAQAQGITLLLASGRPAAGMARAAAALAEGQERLLLISYNGGRISDAATGAVLRESPIPLDLARRLLRHAGDFPVATMVDDGRTVYASDRAGYRVEQEAVYNGLGLEIVPDLADRLAFAPMKVLMSAPPEVIAAVRGPIAAPFAGEIACFPSAPFYLDACRAGVSKGSALREVCTLLGVSPAEAMAFGDSPNDMSMLSLAGHGVAMGNASAEVKAVAREVTLSNNEDGIAQVLERCCN